MFRHARNLPAIVFAVKFVGQKVELRLQVFKDLRVLNRARLPHLQLPFLDLGVEAYRLKRPATLLQAQGCLIDLRLIREKK